MTQPATSPLEALSSCPNRVYQNVEPISPAIRGVLQRIQQEGSIKDAALSRLTEDMGNGLPAKIEVVCPQYPAGSGETASMYELTQSDDSRTILARKLGCATCPFKDTPMERVRHQATMADGSTQTEVRFIPRS